jgi:hypothetical protein
LGGGATMIGERNKLCHSDRSHRLMRNMQLEPSSSDAHRYSRLIMVRSIQSDIASYGTTRCEAAMGLAEIIIIVTAVCCLASPVVHNGGVQCVCV